jgi:TrmH family RNA methyltransferase
VKLVAAPKLVSSRENPLFKRLRGLGSSAQARKKEGLSVIDGAHLLEACLASGHRPELVAVSESGLRRPEIARLAAACAAEVTQFPDALFEALSTVGHGAGIVAALRTPRERMPETVVGDCLLLEHLQDPGNMGSLLRSAAAAGVRQVFCSPRTVYAWSPKVLRAGQGAHFALEIIEGVDLAQVVARLKVPLLATTSHAGHSIYDVDLRAPVGWLIGNEGAGVSDELAAHATVRLSIPMPGVAESLNVAAAGAICMFEAVRQRAAQSKGRH